MCPIFNVMGVEVYPDEPNRALYFRACSFVYCSLICCKRKIVLKGWDLEDKLPLFSPSSEWEIYTALLKVKHCPRRHALLDRDARYFFSYSGSLWNSGISQEVYRNFTWFSFAEKKAGTGEKNPVFQKSLYSILFPLQISVPRLIWCEWFGPWDKGSRAL
jgi:hypothetical protein